MADTRPNHFTSIPRSVGSLKLYLDVHDQPLTRSLLYLALIAAIVAAVSTAVMVVQSQNAHEPLAAELTQALASVQFKDGKAVIAGDMPRVFWTKTEDVATPPLEDGGEPGTASVRQFIIVADTTGAVDSLDKAEELAGCVMPKSLLFFGTEKIYYHTADDRNERPKTQEFDYSDAKKIDEMRKLAGEDMPEVTVKDGRASFAGEAKGLRVVRHTGDIIVLVDTTGRSRGLKDIAREPVIFERLSRPQFLVLLTQDAMQVRYAGSVMPSTCTFADAPPADGAALAGRLASMVTQARTGAALRGYVSQFLNLAVLGFVIALLAAVVGLLASSMARVGLTYSECLSMSLYAVTPATVGAFLIGLIPIYAHPAVLLLGYVVAAVCIAACYTVLGVRRVGLSRRMDEAPTI